jgi:hypothetical protein
MPIDKFYKIQLYLLAFDKEFIAIEKLNLRFKNT